MNDFVESIYLREIARNILSVSFYHAEILKNLKEHETEGVFRDLQNLLRYSSMISKLLWGISGKAKIRSQILRENLKINEDNILKKRRLRDHLEHYDERIDDWAETSENKNMVTNVIGSDSIIGGFNDKDVFTFFNPKTGDFIFRGERFSILNIIKEVHALDEKVKLRLKEIGRIK